MPTSVTAREFNRDSSRVKRESDAGPVFITDRGKPSHVLMTINDYRRIMGSNHSWLDLMGDPDAAGIDLDVDRDRKATFRPLVLD